MKIEVIKKLLMVICLIIFGNSILMAEQIQSDNRIDSVVISEKENNSDDNTMHESSTNGVESLDQQDSSQNSTSSETESSSSDNNKSPEIKTAEQTDSVESTPTDDAATGTLDQEASTENKNASTIDEESAPLEEEVNSVNEQSTATETSDSTVEETTVNEEAPALTVEEKSAAEATDQVKEASVEEPFAVDKKAETKNNKLLLNGGYGVWLPVAKYAEHYSYNQFFALSAGALCFEKWHIYPEIGFGFTRFESRLKPNLVLSEMTITQLCVGLVFSWPLSLPKVLSLSDTDGSLKLRAKIYDGISRVTFESAEVSPAISEYINIFGAGAGVSYPVWHSLSVSIDYNYSIISTAGEPLQSMNVLFGVEYPIP